MGECGALSVCDQEVNGCNVMVSTWQPSPEDIQAFADGATLQLGIYGQVHPVVCMWPGLPGLAPTVMRQLTHPALALLRELEWSARRKGTSGDREGDTSGHMYPACPCCGGLEKANGDFIAEAVGHRPDCRLKEAIQ